MKLMLDEKLSDLKHNVFSFVIVHYSPPEYKYVTQIHNIEEIGRFKYRFKVAYIDFLKLIKDWKKLGFKILIDAVDIPKIFGVYSINRKPEIEAKDRKKYLTG